MQKVNNFEDLQNPWKPVGLMKAKHNEIRGGLKLKKKKNTKHDFIDVQNNLKKIIQFKYCIYYRKLGRSNRK